MAPFDVEVVGDKNWAELKRSLRREVTLKGDSSVHPYSQADLSLETLDLNSIHPLALYVIEENLICARRLYQVLKDKFGIDLLDLPGRLTLNVEPGGLTYLSPPLIEELTGREDNAPGLVDGLHRCYFARGEGINKVRCIVARGMRHPLPTKAAEWNQIRVEREVPPQDRKRIYRYNSLKEFRQHHPSLSATEENYRYYFYRNLELLGSKGIRRKENE